MPWTASAESSCSQRASDRAMSRSTKRSLSTHVIGRILVCYVASGAVSCVAAPESEIHLLLRLLMPCLGQSGLFTAVRGVEHFLKFRPLLH